MVSPPPPKVWGKGRRNFFPQNAFYWGTYFVGKIYSGIFLHVGTNNQNIPREKKFHKMYFPVIWTLQIWKFFPTMVKYLLEDKALAILKEL